MRRSLSLTPLLMMLSLVWLAGCPPKYPACNNDKDCHPNEYCVNQQCQQCRDDKDCGAGETCNKGRCEKSGPKPCSSDTECPADQSCVDGVCKPCVSDNQCGEGGKCQGGRCKRVITPAKLGDIEKPVEGPCALEPVYFDFNESALSTEATSAIERDADCIKKANGKPVTLVGRTDPRGTEEYNLALSDKRAQAVKDRLTRLGADNGGHFKVVPKGELEATGSEESGWAKDRRVDFQW